MISVVKTATLLGMTPVPVMVEVDVNRRAFPRVRIVGEASSSITESQDRVRTAIKNSGFRFPDGKITINLSPANLRKYGAHFDLPIAVGILTASGQLPRSILENTMFFGELSLSGAVRAVPGMISLGEATQIERICMPTLNQFEGNLLSQKRTCIGISGLRDLIELTTCKRFIYSSYPAESQTGDFSSLHGMESAKRAFEIAAAGFHHIHLSGPPGAGKTALASLFPGILPNLSETEFIERARIESLTGNPGEAIRRAPSFRAPHHTVSFAGFIGGGANLVPGEITRAHNGVLFLDEFTEFRQQHIEALRQPLEQGTISLSRLHVKVAYPSRFILVAASNPCPCGYSGVPEKNCSCTAYKLETYRKRISGPIKDRIDLHVNIPFQNVPINQMKKIGETSEMIRERIQRARKRQQLRYKKEKVSVNGLLSGALVDTYCTLGSQEKNILAAASKKLGLSIRGYYKAIKVARTIADLDGHEAISVDHITESLQYRYFST